MAIQATLRTRETIAKAQAAAAASVEKLTEQTPTPDKAIMVESTTTVCGASVAPADQEAARNPSSETFDKDLYGVGDPVVPPAENLGSALALANQGGVPAPASMVSGDEGEFEGEFDSSDLKFPTLMIVQGSSGPLVEQFAQGDLILNNELLFPAPRPQQKSASLRVVPVTMTKSYREVLSPEQITAGSMPRLFKTKAEVQAAGLSLAWFNNPEPHVRKSARIVFVVEAPENTEHPGFGLELDGKAYAVAVYYAKTGAYGATADRVWNVYQTVLFVPVLGPDGKPEVGPNGRPLKRHCIYRNFWKFSWGQVKAGQFNPWRPDMALTKAETGPELREFCANLLRGRSEVSGE